MNLKELLEKHNACSKAIEWAKQFETLKEAWAVCERGDWMLWIAAKAGLCTRKELVFAACQCARLALPYSKSESVLRCIEVTEAWTRDEATIDEVIEARNAAYTAADDDASYAAATAAAAAYDFAYDSDAAAYAADAFDDDAARKNTLKKCADLVRHLYIGLEV